MMDKREHEKLNQLFEQLANGQTPNFFEMMLALEEIGELYPEPQQGRPTSAQPMPDSCPVTLYPRDQFRCSTCG